MTDASGSEVVGVLLAGGRGRRMGGGDKGLRLLGGLPLLTHVVERARPQVDRLVLNANGDPDRFATFGLAVAPDAHPGFAGPLAGVLTGMRWARAEAPGAAWVASFPTDAPFFPRDLVERLEAGRAALGAELACASSAGRLHPVFGLFPTALADELAEALAGEGLRKAEAWLRRHRLAEVAFPAEPFDPFFNVNRPADLAEAERLLAAFDAPSV